MSPLVLALIIVALVLAAIDEVIERGRSLTGWAVIALAMALLIPELSTLSH